MTQEPTATTKACSQPGCDGTALYRNWSNQKHAGKGQDFDSTEGYATKPKGAPDEWGWKCDKCGHVERDK